MPIIVLGLLVIVGLLIFMYNAGELGSFSSKKSTASKEEDTKAGTVIDLPDDLEKEKKKRHVKTGKD